MFYTHETVFCPTCPPVFHRKRPLRQVGPVLECTITNYSGCSVDFGECPKCGKRFQVPYKVDEITEIE